ncbi:MAG: hypothetical protein JST79_02020 [Acidobacteria bacterium]|jgi:hypothetical protein|nr:hypothetical protein [Acidobacteriota bacterium]
MSNIDSVVQQLRKARAAAQKEVERLDAALSALSSGAGKTKGVKRILSIAARKKIAAAQRARWARVRAKKAAA